MMNQTAISVHLLTLGEWHHNYDDPKALNTQLLFHANKPNQYLAQTIFHSTTWRTLKQVVKQNNIKTHFIKFHPIQHLTTEARFFNTWKFFKVTVKFICYFGIMWYYRNRTWTKVLNNKHNWCLKFMIYLTFSIKFHPRPSLPPPPGPPTPPKKNQNYK